MFHHRDKPHKTAISRDSNNDGSFGHKRQKTAPHQDDHNNNHRHHQNDQKHHNKRVTNDGKDSSTSNNRNSARKDGHHGRKDRQHGQAQKGLEQGSASGWKGKGDHPIITPLYESLVNARKIISSLDLQSYHRDLIPAINTLLGHAATFTRQPPSGMDITECSQAFQSLRAYHTTSTRIYATDTCAILKVVMLLDDCYHTLYYCVELHSRSNKNGHQGSGRPPVPPPHIYYPLAITPSTIEGKTKVNNAFQAYLTRNFTTTGLEKLRQIWGFEMNQSTIALSSPSNKKNPLLQVHFARWKESVCLLSLLDLIPSECDVLTMLTSCESQVHSTPSSATMKGNDPLLPKIIREYNDSCRIWLCRLYAFATPNHIAIQRLTALTPMVEIGAGTGYWSHMIRSASSSTTTPLTVHCYDKDPPCAQSKIKHNDYHGRSKAWTDVIKGGPEVVTQFPNCTLFLCYPPPDSPMALLSLRAYTGDCVCYVGEWQGDTGTKAFEKLLCETFVCEEIVPLPNWGDTCYMMMIWRRRKDSKGMNSIAKDIYSNHKTYPVLCSYCGNRSDSSSSSSNTVSISGHSMQSVPMSTSLPLQRCRLSYNIYFCNTNCAINGRNIHIEELASKYLLQRSNVNTMKTVEEDGVDEGIGSKKKRKRDSNSTSLKSAEDTIVAPLIGLSSNHYVRLQSPRYLVVK